MLHKFPKTPHLQWLSPQSAREDKVMAPTEVETFLTSPVIVEEKVDGANLGLSFNGSGILQAQNRGNFLSGRLAGQWEGLRAWLARHEASLKAFLPSRAIIFGEWCYAQHSIPYTRLPDWFVGFDVFEPQSGRFWNTRKRDLLLAKIGLVPIRRIACGRFTLDELRVMLTRPSAYYDGPVEGLYLRRENQSDMLSRAKLVRAEFVQAIGEHWSHGPLRANRLATLRPASV